MIVVFDADGVAHAVDNQTEVREAHAKWGYAENWQVRTRCSPTERLDVFRDNFTKIADLDMTERGQTVTCLRCAGVPCDHGVVYYPEFAKSMTAYEIRGRYPRLSGLCPKGCGFNGIYYASYEHYLAGDW